MEALRKAGAASVEELVGPVYGPLDPKLVKAAGRSLLAHLIKLERERAVRRSAGDDWVVA
jgi:hypothetical protein